MSIDHASDPRSAAAARGPSPVVGLTVAIATGVLIGGLTAYGQGWLSDATTSLANSAGPWSLAAFLVARYNRRVVTAAIAAMLTLASCELGYAIATELRGGSNSTTTVTFWLIAAALAGPPIGIAGAWSTGRGLRRGIGFAVIGGVLLGEGLYGWTTVAETTDWRYWAVESLIGIAIISMAVKRSQWPRHALATIAVATVTAATVIAFGRLV
jgi:hypothetical protein